MKADIEKLFLDSLINSLPDNIYFKDRESRFLMINRALASRFGLKDPSEALGRTDADFFNSEHAIDARNDELHIMKTGEPVIGREEHETTLDGESRWVLTTKLPLHDIDGNMIGTFGVSRDVTAIKKAQQSLVESQKELKKHQDMLEDTVRQRTEQLSAANEQLEKEVKERKQVEQSLRLSEERYRRLLSVNPTYIYKVTLKKSAPIKTEHSEGCFNVTGYSPEEYDLNPNLWIIVVHPEDRDLVKKFVTEDLTQRDHQNQIEHRIIHKDGRLRWVRNTVVHHYDEKGAPVSYDGLIEDITARKFADQRQRENERLTALSQIARGVVENYGKVIRDIAAHTGSIKKRVAPETPLYEHAEAIESAIDLTADINDRLDTVAHTYGRKASSPKATSVKRIISKAVRPFKKTCSKNNIEIKISTANSLPYVHASADQLLDTLHIMLSNSIDAMPDGGTLTIAATTKKILRASHRWNQTARGGTFVILRVRDSGVGMDSETSRHVFEPFFSTKHQGSFGLGLAMAEAAVRSWGGWIRLRSRPAEGTTFRIFLPVAKKEAASDDAPKSAVKMKGKTALVIDDNEQHAAEISEILEKQGVNTLKAHNDEAAIDAFTRNIDKVSICILDMMLGDGDWGKTLARIYELKPETSVIVISGFSRDFVRSNLPVGAWSFLQKPVEPPSLLEMVKELISRSLS